MCILIGPEIGLLKKCPMHVEVDTSLTHVADGTWRETISEATEAVGDD